MGPWAFSLLALLVQDETSLTVISPCEVLRHPEKYVGQEFTFTGIAVQYEHGMYFFPYPSCAEAAAISIADFDSYVTRGGRKGTGILVNAVGRIVRRDTTSWRRKRGAPRTEVVYSVRKILDVKPAPGQWHP
jgi:hypothetical protein